MRKIGQGRSSLQQANYLPFSFTHSMNARKCVNAQKPYSSQAFAHMNQERSEEEGKEETGKTEARRLTERQPNKTKTSEELKQGLPRHTYD